MILQRLGATWLGPKIILQLFQCTFHCAILSVPLCNLVCSMQQSNCSTRTEQDANVTLLHTMNVNTACYSCMFLGYAIVYMYGHPVLSHSPQPPSSPPTAPSTLHRSSSLFIFGYSIFYFYKRSHMYGALQTLEYFGYIMLVCYIFFLTLGTVSFFSSLKFVRYIYQNIKMD